MDIDRYKCAYPQEEFGERCRKDKNGVLQSQTDCEAFCFDPADINSVINNLADYSIRNAINPPFPIEFLTFVKSNKNLLFDFINSEIMSKTYIISRYHTFTKKNLYAAIQFDISQHSTDPITFTHQVLECLEFDASSLKDRWQIYDKVTTGIYFTADQITQEPVDPITKIKKSTADIEIIYINVSCSNPHAMQIVVNNITKEIYYNEPNFASTTFFPYETLFYAISNGLYPSYDAITADSIRIRVGKGIGQGVMMGETCVVWAQIITAFILMNPKLIIYKALGYLIDGINKVHPVFFIYLFYLHILFHQSSFIEYDFKDFLKNENMHYKYLSRRIKNEFPRLSSLNAVNRKNGITIEDVMINVMISSLIGLFLNSTDDLSVSGKNAIDAIDFYEYAIYNFAASALEPSFINRDVRIFNQLSDVVQQEDVAHLFDIPYPYTSKFLSNIANNFDGFIKFMNSSFLYKTRQLIFKQDPIFMKDIIGDIFNDIRGRAPSAYLSTNINVFNLECNIYKLNQIDKKILDESVILPNQGSEYVVTVGERSPTYINRQWSEIVIYNLITQADITIMIIVNDKLREIVILSSGNKRALPPFLFDKSYSRHTIMAPFFDVRKNRQTVLMYIYMMFIIAYPQSKFSDLLNDYTIEDSLDTLVNLFWYYTHKLLTTPGNFTYQKYL